MKIKKHYSILLKLVALLLIVCTCVSTFIACDSESTTERNDRAEQDDDQDLIPSKQTGTSDNKNNGDDTNETLPANALDPFKGIQFTVSGISPYCEIAINNANCDKKIQQYVTFTTDKEKYSNGETAVITASLSYYANYTEDKFTLAKTTMEYKVEDQPEYITSVDGIDFTMLKKELNDYITTQISSSIGTFNFFKIDWGNIYSNHTIVSATPFLEESYLSSLKIIKTDEMNSSTPYNKYSFVYKFTVISAYYYDHSNPKPYTVYVNINANNIVKYKDGSVKWGTKNTDAYDFTYGTSTIGLENCVTTTIMNGSTNYNISQISQ